MGLVLERDEFLAALTDERALAAGGQGRIALIAGEAGIGKTTLVERFVDGIDDEGYVLSGACEALSTPQPLGPLHDIARTCMPSLREQLAGDDRAAIFGALLDELDTPPRPSVLVLEDVHWADAATLDLIRYLARRIHQIHALLVLTFRDDELDVAHPLRSVLGALPGRSTRRFVLPRLSPGSVRRLATAALRNDAGLHEITGGNPFFVTEVLAHGGRDVPASVADAVLARAAQLNAAARTALDIAALVPRSIESELLVDVLADEDAAIDRTRAIDACVIAGLLVADGPTMGFRHELARVAVEAAVAPQRARCLHAHLLARLRTREAPSAPLARLVHHAQGAGDVDAVAALAPRAAHEAAARGALREAAAHDRAALRHADRLVEVDRAMLLDDYATHAFEINDLAAAIPARAEAIERFARLGDRERQCRALAAHAMPLVRALRNADADAASRAAIALAETLPGAAGPGLRARAYATEAYLRMLNRDFVDAAAWGTKAVAAAEAVNDTDLLAFAYNALGAALLCSDYARGIEHVTRSLELARSLLDGGVRVADAYVMLGTGSGEVLRYAEAERWLDEGLAFAREHHVDRLAGYMAAWQALVDVQRGRWTIADERARAVLAVEAADSTNRIVALVALGRLKTRRGDPETAPLLDEALALAERSGTLQRIAPVRATRAENAWLAGDLVAARREAEAGYALALAKGHRWFVGELGVWLARAGVTVEPTSIAASPYADELAGRWADAAAHWEVLGCPYERALALAETGDDGARAALEILDRLGAVPAAERIRRRLKAGGASVVPRGPRESTRANVAGLTTREVEVLELAARGLANAQIADELSRSVRTVEHHIAAILAKLAAGTRGEAVAEARRRGLLSQDG